MSDVRRPRARAVSLFVAIVACIGATFGACNNYQRSNGEACLKDEDCLSNVCTAQLCASPQPALNGSAYADDGGGADAGTDTGTGTGTDSGGAKDSSSEGLADAGKDGPPAIPEAGPDVNDVDVTDVDANDGATDMDTGADSADGADALNVVSVSSLLA